MFEGKRISGIILMAGEGLRFGGDLPKQFLSLGGKKVYQRTLDALLEAGFFDEILLVCHADWVERVRAEAIGARVIAGGLSRQASSYLGLKAFERRPDVVLIHDGVRPFVSERILRDNVAAAIAFGAADTCIASADTLVYAPGGERIESIPKREEYLRGQTPQTFRYDWILEAHEAAIRDGVENASDDCRLVLRTGRAVHVVKGSEENMKITTEFDYALAKTQMELSAAQMR